MIKMMLIAGAGGFVGTCGRFLIGKWSSGMYHGAFPMGTFLVNIIGCFIIGLLFGLLEKAHVMTPGENVLLITGFCGGHHVLVVCRRHVGADQQGRLDHLRHLSRHKRHTRRSPCVGRPCACSLTGIHQFTRGLRATPTSSSSGSRRLGHFSMT